MKSRIKVLLLSFVAIISMAYLVILKVPTFSETLNALLFVEITIFSVLYWEVLWDDT